MRAVPLLRRETVNLEQFIATAVPMLALIPTVEVAVRRDFVQAGAVRVNIDVIFFGAEARLQKRTRLERRLFIKCNEPSTLVKIRGRLDRIEGVEIEEIDLLRKQREADGQAVSPVDYIIKSRK